MARLKDFLSSTIPESDTEEVAAVDASDSSSTILTPQLNNCPCDGNDAASQDQSFKGVIQLQNGNWGAQIYANHVRIWLGTFKSEEEAAMAYDSAAIKLRSGDPHRNFPTSQKPHEESEFQSCHSTEEVLAMIKDGSYRDKLSEHIAARSSDGPENGPGCASLFLVSNPDGVVLLPLFQKVLTPSDVGKLNRLVIPKKNAIKFFPRIYPWDGERGAVGEDYGIQQVFYDRSMKLWNFRYCYWSSSHSFVFTRGWNLFVKEKELRSGDRVLFYECSCHDHDGREEKKFYMIDVAKNIDVNMTAKCSDDEDPINGREEKEFYMIDVAKRAEGNIDAKMTAKCSDDEDANDGREEEKFYMINVAKRVEGNIDMNTTAKCADDEDATDGREEEKFYMIDVAKRVEGNIDMKTTAKCSDDDEDATDGDSDGSQDLKDGKQQVFKLFGVEIVQKSP